MERTKVSSQELYVSRAQKQHSSLVIVIPKNVKLALELDRGDLVVLDLRRTDPPQAYLSKFVGGKNHGKG